MRVDLARALAGLIGFCVNVLHMFVAQVLQQVHALSDNGIMDVDGCVHWNSWSSVGRFLGDKMYINIISNDMYLILILNDRYVILND